MVGPRGPNPGRLAPRSPPPPSRVGRLSVGSPVGRVGRLGSAASAWQTALSLFFFFLHWASSRSSSCGSPSTFWHALLVMSPLCRHFATLPRILVISEVGRLVGSSVGRVGRAVGTPVGSGRLPSWSRAMSSLIDRFV